MVRIVTVIANKIFVAKVRAQISPVLLIPLAPLIKVAALRVLVPKER